MFNPTGFIESRNFNGTSVNSADSQLTLDRTLITTETQPFLLYLMCLCKGTTFLDDPAVVLVEAGTSWMSNEFSNYSLCSIIQ